jgi:hypothetical protein
MTNSHKDTDQREDMTSLVRSMSIEQIAGIIVSHKAEIKELREFTKVCEYQLTKIIQETGSGTMGLPSANYKIEYKRGTPSYDVNKLKATLGEQLPPDEMKELIAEEYTKLEVIPEKVRGAKAYHFKRRYGGKIAELIDKARVDMPRLFVSEKKGSDED